MDNTLRELHINPHRMGMSCSLLEKGANNIADRACEVYINANIGA